MKTKFTKGEWTIENSIIQENEYISIKSNKVNVIVCDKMAIAFCGTNINLEGVANAKLIAAAPDLLEAAEFSKQFIEYIKSAQLNLWSDKMQLMCESLYKLDAAIKKATE